MNMNHEHTHPKHGTTLTFNEKIHKILHHWLNHNDEHAQTYLDWAEKAKANAMSEVGTLLEEAAEITKEISKKFEEALAQMKGQD